MVIDGNNILVRAVKAMERSPLSSHGVSTGPLLSFINCISRYVREWKPTKLVVCFDGGKSFYRTAIDANYKANRAERTHDEFKDSSFALAKEFLALANIHFVEVPQVEADDLIAAYWRHKAPEDEFAILSGDKDFFQLVDPNTHIFRPGEDKWYDEEEVYAKMGCLPRDIPAVMALTGDTSDNIPGVPGFGTKTAVKFLKAHDWSLDALFNTEDPKLAAKIEGQKERVDTNLLLVDLRSEWIKDQVPVGEIPAFRPTGKDNVLLPELIAFLSQYEMNSVKDRLFNGTLWMNPQQRALLTTV